MIYGRNLASKAITVLGSGDFALDLAKISQKIETKPVTTTSTPEHFTFSAGIRSRPKKVVAKGAKYIGYSLTVRSGETVVGRASNPVKMRRDAEK